MVIIGFISESSKKHDYLSFLFLFHGVFSCLDLVSICTLAKQLKCDLISTGELAQQQIWTNQSYGKLS